MKKHILALIATAITVTAVAVPARREGVLRTNAEGQEIMTYLHGNESFHYMTDENGNWLDEETLLPLSEEIKNARSAMRQESPMAKARRARQEVGTSRLLAPRGIVILVSFKDLAFSQTNADMTQWAMGETYDYNGATGSIHQYFYDQSWGQYDMKIDVVGPVTVSKNYSYYGQNDWSGYDRHPDEMVQEACKLADEQGIDFSQYDSDGDGKVDWVVILYAGQGEADGGSSNTIWPHQYELSYTGMSIKLDGKTVDHYCCLNEIDGQTGGRCGIGTFCHEFSHIMGLPDFYATTETASHRTLVDWDIMDYGPYNNNGNTPPNYSAYERWFMGWMTPQQLKEPANVTLRVLHEHREAILLCEEDHNLDGLNPYPRTFFLLETRTRKGWDTYIPGAGMMITKIKYSPTKWEENTVNNTSTDMGVDIIEARTNTNTYTGSAYDLFPRGSKNWYGFEGHDVENIARNALTGAITFIYDGGWPESIEEVPGDEVQCTKVLRDGNVFIIREGKTYDMFGRICNR